MILSDRDIRAQLEAGRVVIDPFDAPSAVQPSSIDLRVGHQFRVFANNRYPYIDVREPMEGLTELVEASEQEPFILHPGEFVLASTLESVSLPDDLVARLEGKSSLGRLGLLIHSSLPAGEPVLFLDGDGRLAPRPIDELVQKRLPGAVVAFDPVSFAVSYEPVTGWYEGPPDRIYEVVLASGRRVRVTAGHNLFTVDRDGELRKVRTRELVPGLRVAVPAQLADPPAVTTEIDLVELAPEASYGGLVCDGPAVAAAFAAAPAQVASDLRDEGYRHVDFYRRRSRLPLGVALLHSAWRDAVAARDRLTVRGSHRGLPVVLPVDRDLAWLLGRFVTSGRRRRDQVVLAGSDTPVLDRIADILGRLAVPVRRSAGAVTGRSTLLSHVMSWLDPRGPAGDEPRVPPVVFGWPRALMAAFLDGCAGAGNGDGDARHPVWTSSRALSGDLQVLRSRLGHGATVEERHPGRDARYRVTVPTPSEDPLAAVNSPDGLLAALGAEAGHSSPPAVAASGMPAAGRPLLRLAALRRLAATYAEMPVDLPSLPRLVRLADGDLRWDRVVEVVDTGTVEPVFDLEVRPGGRRVENFLAGTGGVFVSNTAGFIDAGWSGHLTLELSNVANLPITIYPGMKIGQLALFRLSSPAEVPYGSDRLGSKYQGQSGPTASRYFENFRDTAD